MTDPGPLPRGEPGAESPGAPIAPTRPPSPSTIQPKGIPMSSVLVERRITAEEFAGRPGRRRREELVRGRPAGRPSTPPHRGMVCGQAYFLLRLFVEARRDGVLLCGDVGVLTARSPDTVRCVDVAYYPRARLPAGGFPRAGDIETPPELAVEVHSPDARWADVLARASELLLCGVSTVLVLDPAETAALVFRQDEPVRILQDGDEIALRDDLEGFRARVDRFFG